MPRTPIWRRYLRFFGPDVKADVHDELRFHLESKIGELVEQGRSPEQARVEALRQFGDIQEVSALCRRIGEEEALRAKVAEHWNQVCHDLRLAVRSLRRAPGVALIAVATLAAGIGATSSMFSVVDAWIIRAVRFPNPGQLVFARALDTRQGREMSVSFADYQDLRAGAREFQSLAAWSYNSYTLISKEGAERVAGAAVSPNFFSTLRVQPVRGRAFLPQEGEHGRRQAAIVSYGFWKARLNGAESAIGSTLNLDGETYTVVGVLPERFHLTIAGRANIWTPLAPTPQERSRRQDRFLQLIGRLKPGVTVARGRQELQSTAKRLAAAYPGTNLDIGIFCISLSGEIGRHTGDRVILIIFAVTLGLLLIACANVANLLLVWALARKRQASIQLSLGASRGRLIRQGLVETLLIFLLSGAAGTLSGWWWTGLITGFIPYRNRGFLPDYGEASLNWTVLGFVLAITLFTGLISGLVPALENARANVLAVLKESGTSVSQNRTTQRLRLTLVTAQIALAAILLSSTIILVRGFGASIAIPLGFDSAGVLTFQVLLDEKQYAGVTRQRIFFESAADATTIPGQPLKPAIARFIPFGDSAGRTTFRLQEQPPAGSKRLPSAALNAVSPEYFATLRTPVLAGRAFDTRDRPTQPLVAIVNRPFVSKYLPNQNPLGQTVWLTHLKDRAAKIVGVVAEVRTDNDPHLAYPQIYVPFAQDPSPNAHLLLRTQAASGAPSNPLDLLPEIRRRIAAIDPRQPVYEAETLDDLLTQAFAPYRILSGMLVWYGLLALILAAIGVYGVVAFSVSQRTREIGIRAALGADRSRLLGLFLRQGFVILAAGLLPGLVAAAAAGMGLRSLFEELVATSLLPPLLWTALVLGGSVLIAALVPARKAASVDPLAAIRYE